MDPLDCESTADAGRELGGRLESRDDDRLLERRRYQVLEGVPEFPPLRSPSRCGVCDMLALKPVALSEPLRLLFGMLMLPTSLPSLPSLTRRREFRFELVKGELEA
jgi:hypothetical protein